MRFGTPVTFTLLGSSVVINFGPLSGLPEAQAALLNAKQVDGRYVGKRFSPSPGQPLSTVAPLHKDTNLPLTCVFADGIVRTVTFDSSTVPDQFPA